MGAPVVVALGSNVGDPLANLRRAVAHLIAMGRVMCASSAYRTAPMYVLDQADFLNAVLILESDLGPREVLAGLKEIEQEIGRQARHRNGPREIDLDLLAYGALKYRFGPAREAPKLVVPHPRLDSRRFVLEPLAEIAPELIMPGFPSVRQMLEHPIVQAQAVERLDEPILV